MSNDNSVPRKQCTRCDNEYPATMEHFAPQKGGKYGLYSRCRECVKELSREYHATDEYKKRRHYLRNTPEGKIKEKSFRDKPETKTYQKQYRETYKEKLGEHRKLYDANPLNKLRARERAALPENRERAREQDRRPERRKRKLELQQTPEYKAKVRAQRNTPHGKLIRKAHDQRRRARVNNAPGVHTAEDEQKQYEAQEGLCFYCGIRLFEDFEADHYVPLSRGGSNWPDNIVCCCTTCNRSKGNLLESEWRERRGW